MKKVILIIRDGWGYSLKNKGNAIANAATPFNDWLLEQEGQVMISCHGEAVGLPAGFQGSSEVGHLNMGAGRIVIQEVTRIFDAIKNKEIFSSEKMKEIDKILRTGKNNIHFMGLLQNEGVHAHQEHLFQLLKYFRNNYPEKNIWIHPIADGRDTPPKSFLQFYNQLIDVIGDDSRTNIGTVCGRYYGMDRSKNWKLISIALEALIKAEGFRTDDFISTVENMYASDKTPDDVPMFDEYLTPIINKEYEGINAGDVVINFNYRQDRAIQISQALTDTDCPIYRKEFSKINYYGLTRYYDQFTNYLMPAMDDSGGLKNILGQVLSEAGKTQLRIAETQKFRHVTSFFNGKSTKPFPGEKQIEIPGTWDPSSFASHPEMNAHDVTAELLSHLNEGFDFIAVNYANCDMVGHTGDYDAAMKGAECVDENVEKIARYALQKNYAVIITADHGNSEEMLDDKGNVKTSHTLNSVKLHLIDSEKKYKLTDNNARLSDITTLILKLMDINIPVEMTSRILEKQI